MKHHIPFPLENFENYCKGLHRVGVEPGFVMYTNSHAGNHLPAARILPAIHMEAARAYIDNPTDAAFKKLVAAGVLLDTEWDRNSENWRLIAFEGWEVLHMAFSRLHVKAADILQDLTGVNDLDIPEGQ
ncbi:MAG: hypothetical protein ABSB19_19565 [Methylomonas sp.]|jgi:hypothetical protein